MKREGNQVISLHRKEGIIGRYFVNNTREMHMGGIPSNLPKKLNRKFNLQLLKLQGVK
jgi:hypothetical protein